MERLTKREKGANRINCDNCGAKGNCMIPNTCLCEITDRLAAYEDAEEAGLLIRLPCKMGDTVYTVIDGDIVEVTVSGFTVYSNFFALNVMDENGNDWRIVGNNYYHTYAEAEAALAKEGCT